MFWDTKSLLMKDVNRSKRLLKKLIYLIVTHPNIVYTVGVFSRFIQEPCEVHWVGAFGFLAYRKRAPSK